MPGPIFRQEALDRLSSPERLDQLMQVVSPRAWVALTGVGLVLATALFWGWFGNIPTTATARGVLLRQGGHSLLTAPADGVVHDVTVLSGEEVPKGQLLAQLTRQTSAGSQTQPIVCPFEARVLERRPANGAEVKQGETLFVLEPLRAPLRARLFVPVTEGYRVDRGMTAQVWPSQVQPSEYGYLYAKVIVAVKFPVSQPEVLRVVNNEELARQLVGQGPCLQVVLELTPDPTGESVSGYRWSSWRGNGVQLYSGSPCEARIVLDEQRPIQLLFPGLGGR